MVVSRGFYFMISIIVIVLVLCGIAAMTYWFDKTEYKPQEETHRNYNRPGDPPDLLS